MTNSNAESEKQWHGSTLERIFLGVLTIALIHVFVAGQIFPDNTPSTLLESGTFWVKLAYAVVYAIGFMISLAIFQLIGWIEIVIMRSFIKFVL